MSWEREVEGIEQRRELARQHGGADAVARQHAHDKLTVRERIDLLVDAQSFNEHGSVAGVGEEDASGALKSFGPANVVTGVARIDGRPVVVCGDDFTIGGGAYHAVGIRKGAYGDELAYRRKLPLVRLLEGGGARITGALGARGRSGYDLTSAAFSNRLMSEVLASVPVVCVALGSVAGFPAARLVASHLSIMTRKTSQVLIGGPALVERATREKLTKEELGGPDVHLRSGVVDNLAEDEADALRQAQAIPELPAVERARAGVRSPRVRSARAPRRAPARDRAARAPARLQDAARDRERVRPRFLLRDERAVRPLADHGAGAARGAQRRRLRE